VEHLERGIGPAQGLLTAQEKKASTPRVGFVPTVPVFERWKTQRTSDPKPVQFVAVVVVPPVVGIVIIIFFLFLCFVSFIYS
jgi:hypothetical protein